MKNLEKLDLQQCAAEPIRIPGSIQPHGMLIGLDPVTHRVLQVSDNLAKFTGMTAQQALSLPLREVVGEQAAELLQTPDAAALGPRVIYLGAAALPAGLYADVMAHMAQGMLLLEFEPVSREQNADFRRLYPLLGRFLAALEETEDVLGMGRSVVQEIQRLTGFGRVLLYRFNEEGHGHVLAETVEPGYHAYLNQWFPASDVPPQARDLYVANRVRLIVDSDYQPSQLVPPLHPRTGEALDLSMATLRSVSPVHLQYMRNMGTGASMSVSVVVRGRLWGLVSCHNHAPRSVPFEARAACEQLAQVLALRIQACEDLEEYDHRLSLRERLVRMLPAIGQAGSFLEGMGAVSNELLNFAAASGAAVVFQGEIVRFGDAPELGFIQRLVQFLAERPEQGMFQTRCLSQDWPQAEVPVGQAAGVLAISISQIHRHWLIWFRPEFVQSREWAGNPHDKQATPGGMLSPRQSFESWRELVRGQSRPWRHGEIESALELRSAILGIVLEQAEQMAELAEELGRANKELEAFSYSVSHDLRAPMRHIVGFSDLLLEFEGAQISERGRRFLANIKDSAHFAGKLVDDLLSFSQMGRSALHLTQVDMNEMVSSQIERLTEEVPGRSVRWQVDSLPSVQADPAFLHLAIYNLLSNAVKYTRQREVAEVHIYAEERPDAVEFFVKDNGVGFSEDYVHKLFGVFQRLHRMEDFEGTGIGLANVKRIVERHGGSVTARGQPDVGATFSFSLPKTSEGSHNA